MTFEISREKGKSLKIATEKIHAFDTRRNMIGVDSKQLKYSVVY